MASSTEDKIRAVNAYINAFCDGDAEAVVEIYAKDATVEDPVGTPLKKGHDEIRKFYIGAMATGAKLELTGAPRCAGDYVAFPFSVNMNMNGKQSLIEIIDIFRVNEDGKVTEMRAFWGPENMNAG